MIRSLSPNIAGILLMTLAMALLTIGDAMIKILSDRYDRSVFMSVAGLGLVIVYLVVARFTRDSVFDKRALSGIVFLRSWAEVLAAFIMMLALATVPFTIVSLILQAIPIIITAGAVVFLGEKVGWHRWAAIAAGFIGVLIVLQPTSETFDPVWLLAVGAALAMSARDLISRVVPKEFSALQISIWSAMAVSLTGYILHFARGEGLPSVAMGDWPAFALIVICWAGGVWSLNSAMRLGEVSVVAPFRYMRLPFGIAVGVVVFSETLDIAMMTGAVIIVASGWYIFMRERKQP